MSWSSIYYVLHIDGLVAFASSPALQEQFFPIKLVFMAFTVFFFCAVIYFYINSSYLQYQFLQDTAEFFSWQAYGLRETDRHWKRIMKRTEGGSQEEYKIAVVEADDFLFQTLKDREYAGETFEELLESARKNLSDVYEKIEQGHIVRNSIIRNPDYTLDLTYAKEVLASYEVAVKTVAVV